MPLPIHSYEEGEIDGFEDTEDSTNRLPVIRNPRAESTVDRIMEERIVPDVLHLNLSLRPSRLEMGQGSSMPSLSTILDTSNVRRTVTTEFLRLRSCYGTSLYLWMRRDFIPGRGFDEFQESGTILGCESEAVSNVLIDSFCDFLLRKQDLQYERAPIIHIPSLPSFVALLIRPDFARDRKRWEPIIQAHTGHTIAEIARDSFDERVAPSRPAVPRFARRNELRAATVPLQRSYANFLQLRGPRIIRNTRYPPNYTPIITPARRLGIQDPSEPSPRTPSRLLEVADPLPTSPTPGYLDTSDDDDDDDEYDEYGFRNCEGPLPPRPRRRSMSPQRSPSKRFRHIYRFWRNGMNANYNIIQGADNIAAQA